jgi:hypothetical protein
LDMIGNTTCEKACSVLKGQHWGLKAVDALSSFHPLDTVSYLWDSLSQHPTSLYGGYFINNSSYNPEQTREFWNSAVYCQNAHTRNTTEFLRYICWVKNERRHNVELTANIVSYNILLCWRKVIISEANFKIKKLSFSTKISNKMD